MQLQSRFFYIFEYILESILQKQVFSSAVHKLATRWWRSACYRFHCTKETEKYHFKAATVDPESAVPLLWDLFITLYTDLQNLICTLLVQYYIFSNDSLNTMPNVIQKDKELLNSN